MIRPVALALLALVGGCADETSPPPPSARCVSCHRAEYEREHGREPVARRKPATCASCHGERAWHPTAVRHGWPLTGAHADALCTACHAAPALVYEGTPAACVGCHRADYDGAREPSHRGFATTCAGCHTTAAWSPATGAPDAGAPAATPAATRPTAPARPTTAPRPTVPTRVTTVPTPTPVPAASEPAHPESRFPIARGDHANITCRRCHSRGGANGRANTDCVQCHPRSRFDDVHDRVGRYPTGAAAPNFCVTCHTRGTRSRR